MKIVANINNKKLRTEQFNTLVDVLDLIKSREDLKIFLESFLSESEQAYLGQRLNIMRMLAKNFNYSQIKDKIHASGSTISNAQKCLDSGGRELLEIVLQYKFKSPAISEAEEKNPFKSHRPGSISR